MFLHTFCPYFLSMPESTTEKINEHILLIKQQDKYDQFVITVCYDYIPVAKFNKNILSERRLAAVQLVEQHTCNKQIAAQICGFHRNTVTNLLTIKNTLGVEAMLEDNRGLKKPLKYSDDIRQTIQRLLSEHENDSDQQIARRASEELNTDISRSAVLRVRTARVSSDDGDGIFSRDRLMELSTISETIDLEKNNQLELNFEVDPTLKQKKEELEQLEPLTSSNKTEKKLINRLQEGMCTPFAGSLMHYLFLQEVDFQTLFDCLPVNKGNTYQHIDILMTLFFSIANDIKSIEALKLINSKDLGCVLGMDRSPDKDVIRKRLQTLAETNPSAELIDRFARILLENHRIDDEVFFIDGHFLPYYGLLVIAKGYYTVRRLAMRGNELYFVSDLNGCPLFSITESNDIDFRPIISRAADKLVDLGIKRPILTFDRGGYGIRFFSELNEKADFVTWAKYLKDSQLNRINNESFKQCIAVNDKKYLVAEQWRDVSESVQTARKEGREQPISMNLRLVVIENIETGKRIGIFSNNKHKSASDIAFYMLNRWGDSENLYKEFMAKFNLNYHPGYDIDELEKQPLVDNPDIQLIKKAIHILQKEIEAFAEIQLDVQTRLNKRQDKRLSKKLSRVIKERNEKIDDKTQFEEKLKSLPDKVSIVTLLHGKKMSRCDLEKKRLYDLMQCMVFHSFERLQDIFENCYEDNRDIKPVLKMIATQGGYLKLIGDTLIVVLDRIDLLKHRLPAEQMCHRLNKQNIVLNGRVKMKLYFHLSRF